MLPVAEPPSVVVATFIGACPLAFRWAPSGVATVRVFRKPAPRDLTGDERSTGGIPRASKGSSGLLQRDDKANVERQSHGNSCENDRHKLLVVIGKCVSMHRPDGVYSRPSGAYLAHLFRSLAR